MAQMILKKEMIDLEEIYVNLLHDNIDESKEAWGKPNS